MATCANAEVTSGDGWSFDSDTGFLQITGDGYINDLNVGYYDSSTMANDWRHNVQSIQFGADVTRVPRFNGDLFDGLTSVEFDKNSTVDLSDASFGTCSSLSHISFPNNALINNNVFSTQTWLIDVGTGVNPQSTPNFNNVTVFCSDPSCKATLSNEKTGELKTDLYTYEVDADGVYTFNDGENDYMFASSGDMLYWYNGDSSLACETHEACAAKAAANRLSGSGGSGGNVNNNSGSQSEPKRIYTLEEARQAVEAAGTDTVNVRIRYK